MTQVGEASALDAAVDPAPTPPPDQPSGRSGGPPRWAMAAIAVAVVLVLAALVESVGESVVIGSTENAPLVLAALGFALLYRLTGLLNVAFAETITLGAYLGMWMNNTFGWGVYAVVLPAGILAGLVSVATYLLIFRVAKQRHVGDLEMIVISFGLALFLRHALQFVWGYEIRFFDIGLPSTVQVFGVGVPVFRLVALASVAALAVAIYQFIRRTSYGLQIRALASNEGLAQASGVQPLRVTMLIWFVAGLAGGLAGVFYGVASSVSPQLGARQLLLILLVVLVGGIWGLLGVVWVGVAAGIALTGMTLELGNGQYAELVLLLAFFVVLKLEGRALTRGSKV